MYVQPTRSSLPSVIYKEQRVTKHWTNSLRMKKGVWGIQSLKVKYLYQHPLLEHCQPTFVPQYGRPSFHTN